MKITRRRLKQLILEVMPTSQFFDDETIPQQFKKWATKYMGSPAGANSSSVLATFLVDQGYDKDENIVADMSGVLGFDLHDVEMEVKRQRREYDAGGTISDQESYEKGFRESVLRVTKKQLKRIIREEQADVTKKYDDDSALVGDQSKLKDPLQKAIIDKTVEDREEAKEKEAKEKETKEKSESMRITKTQLRRIIREEMEKAGPFGSGMQQADMSPEEKELVGHT
jgi:hypothetical protein